MPGSAAEFLPREGSGELSTSTLLVTSTGAPSTQTILLVALLGGLAASGVTGVVSARLQKRRLEHETAERQ